MSRILISKIQAKNSTNKALSHKKFRRLESDKIILSSSDENFPPITRVVLLPSNEGKEISALKSVTP
jgi:hypothetical protein